MSHFQNQNRNRNAQNRRPLGRRMGGATKVIPFVVIGILILAGLVFGIASAFVPGEENSCVVTDKDRTTDREGNSQARIYTENCGTFKVGDNWFAGQFNSADVYGGIEVGSTYDFETRGFRVPVLSSFPNIVEVTEQ